MARSDRAVRVLLPASRAPTMGHDIGGEVDLRTQLRRWVERGLLAPEQAEAIAAFEAEEVPPAGADGPERRVSLISEAVGYVGAALIVIALAVLLERFWADFTLGAKLALVAVVTATLVAAGWGLRAAVEPAGARLASVAWVAAVGTLGWGVGIATGPTALDLTEDDAVLAIATATAVGAGVLWWLRHAMLQHAAAFLTAVATLVSLMALPEGAAAPRWHALALLAFAVVWLLLTEAGWFRPADVGVVLGLALVLVALQVAVADEAFRGPGLVLALVGATGMVAGAIARRRPFPLWFGTAGVFVFVPQAVFHFFRDTLGAPIALLVTGFVLLGVAIGSARLREEIAVVRSPGGGT